MLYYNINYFVENLILYYNINKFKLIIRGVLWIYIRN